jgi:hypothetical protein
MKTATPRRFRDEEPYTEKALKMKTTLEGSKTKTPMPRRP